MNTTLNNKSYFILLIMLLTIKLRAQVQVSIWPSVSSEWNKISCTFSEIHPTGTDHIHGAIDINMSNGHQFKAILDGKVSQDASVNDFFIIEHELQDPTDIDSGLKRVRYGDETDPLSGINNLKNVNQGQSLGKMTSGGHLHFEMWIRDAVISPWRRVNPLDNPNVDYTNLPPNEPDAWNPELNDVVLHGISEPAGTNSGIIATGTGVVNGFQGNHTRIHFLNHPGQASTNGLPYDSNTGKIIVFGSIGSILHERDSRVTNPPSAIGTGLGIDAATFSINGQEKYRVKFDEILETELTRTTDFYATTFDAPMAFGNNDYLKMRRITGETARRPHKQIGGIQSNGVWATRAKTTAPDVFATTPTELAMCPDQAKYPDGKHTLNFTVSDAANNTDSKDIVAIVDNFKPFIKELEIKFKGTTIYAGHWQCDGDCMKFVVTIAPQAYQIATATDANKFEVIATFSESMDNTVALKLTQGTVLGTANTSVASDNKIFTTKLEMYIRQAFLFSLHFFPSTRVLIN